MSQYDKTMGIFNIVLLVIGLVSIAWGILRASIIGWQHLMPAQASLMVYAAIIGGIVFLSLSIKGFVEKQKTGKITHGFDEKSVKIVNNSLRNVALAMLLILYGAVLYYALLHDTSELLFNLKSIAWVVLAAIVVFIISFTYYDKEKDL
jgi:hypothetical protein